MTEFCINANPYPQKTRYVSSTLPQRIRKTKLPVQNMLAVVYVSVLIPHLLYVMVESQGGMLSKAMSCATILLV